MSEPGFELRITPQGHVVVVGGGQSAIASRFAEHEAAGMVALAASGVPEGAAESVGFWHEVAAECLQAWCHVPEGDAFSEAKLERPSALRLAEWVLNAPPMPGGEYLTPNGIAAVWERMVAWMVERVEAAGGLAAFFGAYAPRWARIGRVSLHLAEQKGDDTFPFAFMASYAAGLTNTGKIRRLPLGKALEGYAGAGRKQELVKLLSPLHAAAKRSTLIQELVASGDVFHPLAWTPEEAYAFLREIPLYEECGLFAQVPNWWRKRSRPQVSVSLDVGKGGAVGMKALLNFDIGVALGNERLSTKEIEQLMQTDQRLVRLKGEWVEMDREKLQAALEHWKAVEREVGESGISFASGMRLLAGVPADLGEPAAGGDEEEESTWHRVMPGETLRDTLAAMRNPDGLGSSQPQDLRATLRSYQLAGVNWLWLCSRLGVGACLADDMGLGKTIQVLATLLRQRRETAAASLPSLLVVPASLIGNWQAESARFAPDLKLLVAHPSETPKPELDRLATSPARHLRGIDLVITSYSMVTRLAWLAKAEWSWLVLDEAQAIKNPSSRQTKAVKALRAHHRVALTGTPVENRLGDLWSIFDFINPGLLGSATKFREFSKSLARREHARYAPLRRLVAPYILRRMKTDPGIAPELPAKTEMRVFCGLAKPQAMLYQQAVITLKQALENEATSAIQRRGLVLGALMRFKQICNHPSLFSGDGSYAAEASGKLERLGALCGEIASRGEKVLVFTQFREMCDPLQGYLSTIFSRPGLVLHGGTAVARRKDLVRQFQDEQGPPYFILSIKAGGTGLNLTAASHVIHFDRWWNPAVENQATDRAFRIGQQRGVLVHKFVTRGTIEEKIDALIEEKQLMSNEILEGDSGAALTEMSDEQILSMIALDLERAMG